MGKYLYCIIPYPQERLFAEAIPLEGCPDSVVAVPQGNLSAVVSTSSAARYESTRANLLAHTRVLETVMREFTLLPVRFGTVAEGPEPVASIKTLLEKRGPEFRQFLAQVEGRVELGLKVLWRDEKAVYQELLVENPALQRLRDSLRGLPLEASREERIWLGEMVKRALEEKRSREAAALLDSLRPLAAQVVENPCLGDRMVVNAAFLVEKEQEPQFDLAARALEADLGHRLALRYVGPVPPYNFVNITVNWQEL